MGIAPVGGAPPARATSPVTPLQTPTTRAAHNAATIQSAKLGRASHAEQYHVERLEARLRNQRVTACALGVVTIASFAVGIALTWAAGPVALAAVWVIPSGLFGGLVGVWSEIAGTQQELRQARQRLRRQPCGPLR